MARFLLLSLGIVASASEDPVSTSAPLVSSKLAAVEKAMRMLEDLRTKVMSEGEEEAKAYDRFACFCKDTTAEKLDAITKNEDEGTTLSAQINDLATQRDAHDDAIKAAEADIAQHDKDLADAKEARLKERKSYETNSADMKAALSALEGAMAALKAAKRPSFAELRDIAGTLQATVGVADALGVGGKVAQRAVASLLQESDVPTENYKFHADDVITTLEGLQTDFRKESDNLDKAEVEAQNTHDKYVQDKQTAKERDVQKLEKSQKARADAIADIETANQNYAVIEAELLQDKEYASKLSKMCADKARTWDQRKKLRTDELSALSQALAAVQGVISANTNANTLRLAQQAVSVRAARARALNVRAMGVLEAEAEAVDDGAPSLVQMGASKPWRPIEAMLSSSRRLVKTRQHLRGLRNGNDGNDDNDGGRREVADLLRSRGRALHSTLLSSLAAQVGGDDPLAKVKVLIQELIERLLQQASNEATQKGWCDKAMSEAEQKRDYADGEIRAVNVDMAKLEARRDKLGLELHAVVKEIEMLTASRKEAEDNRALEKSEHEAVISEAKEGLDAMNQIIDILEKFYKSAAKAKVELAQTSGGPEDDAPDAGFDAGEAYTGSQDAKDGIIGLLDVMRSDFVRTVEETERAEKEAEQDHVAFMTETGKSLVEKETAEKEMTKYKDETETKLGEASDKLDSETEKVNNAVKELLELKPTCVDTGMSWEDRVAMRDDEIAALKKAHCILEAYAEYGPDGTSGADC